MVIDTSAIFAILNDEPEAERFAEAISSDSVRLMSSATALEIFILVRARKGEPGITLLKQFLKEAKIDIIDFDESQFQIAVYAFENYGKGMNKPGKLNFGDCFSYALSIATDEPLLFKGNDFSQTDLKIALT